MSKREFNPYRDMLDIPSLKDDNPTDYQLLGVDDFEGDSEKIAAAHEKRSQRIAELYQIVTEMSRKIDAARDRISDPQQKEEYDLDIRRKGRAGVAHLSKAGSCAVLVSFVLSIFIVVVSTFYIYPMVVAVPVENIGDSVETLPDYNKSQARKETDFLKSQQENVSTMDPGINIPIDVDDDIGVEFCDSPGTDNSPETPADDNLSLPDNSLTESEPAGGDPAPMEELTIPQEKNVEEPALPENTEPELPAQAEEKTPQPVDPLEEKSSQPEPPAEELPPMPELPAEIESPDVPPAEAMQTPAQTPNETPTQTPAETPTQTPTQTPAETPVETPNETPADLGAPLVPENSPLPENRSGSIPPLSPKELNMDNSEIPELPPPLEFSESELPLAPQAPAIPELTTAPEPPDAPQPPAFSELSFTSKASLSPNVPAIENTAATKTETADASETLAAPEPQAAPTVNVADRDGSQVEAGSAEKLREASNEWRENASVTQNPLATRTDRVGSQLEAGSSADRVGSQLEAGNAENGSFGDITSSTRPRGSAPQLATPPSGVALEDVDKLELIVQLGRKARTDADFAQLLYSASQAEEELMKEKMFPKAQQIADVVYSYCARFADKSYRAEAYRHKELVSQRSAWWESVRAAEAKMAAAGTLSPADANVVAQWKIEIENDWDAGLKYLAMSDNEQIRMAAKNEIAANPADVQHAMTVANGWWNLSQNLLPLQKQFRAHACQWYAKALPSIADKQIRTLVEKRISIAENGYSKH